MDITLNIGDVDVSLDDDQLFEAVSEHYRFEEAVKDALGLSRYDELATKDDVPDVDEIRDDIRHLDQGHDALQERLQRIEDSLDEQSEYPAREAIDRISSLEEDVAKLHEILTVFANALRPFASTMAPLPQPVDVIGEHERLNGVAEPLAAEQAAGHLDTLTALLGG